MAATLICLLFSTIPKAEVDALIAAHHTAKEKDDESRRSHNILKGFDNDNVLHNTRSWGAKTPSGFEDTLEAPKQQMVQLKRTHTQQLGKLPYNPAKYLQRAEVSPKQLSMYLDKRYVCRAPQSFLKSMNAIDDSLYEADNHPGGTWQKSSIFR